MDPLGGILGNDGKSDDSSVSVPSPGKGFLHINLGARGIRTILPHSSDQTFTYVVTITGNNPTPTPDFNGDNFFSWDGIADVELPEGNYTVKVEAFTGITNLVAEGEDDDVSVGATGGSAVIEMEWVDLNGIGQGTLTWNFSGGIAGRTLETGSQITFLDLTGSATPAPITLDSVPVDSTGLSFDAGEYLATVTINIANFQSITFNTVVHIYPNLVTNWVESTAFVLSPLQYTVTFNANGGFFNPGPSQTTTETGTVNFNSVVAAPTPPERGGFNFENWRSEGDGAGAIDGFVWNFANHRVIGPLTLYAAWILSVDLAINLDFEELTNNTSIAGSPSNPTNLFGIQGATSNIGYVVTFTADITNGTVSGNYTWRFGGVDLSTISGFVTGSNGETLMIDFKEINDNSTGTHASIYGLLNPTTHIITVEAVDDGGQHWSARVNVVTINEAP
jgi:hypothetical protein